MSRRLELHAILKDILGSGNVYFQPPESLKLNYPCIIYSRSAMDPRYADNKLYSNRTRYKVTIVDKNPDTPILGQLAQLPYCSFNTHYNKDNLNHDVYTLYF